MELLDFLKSTGIDISPELQKGIHNGFHKRQYKKGDLFYEPGKVCTDLGFLIEGQAALQHIIDGDIYTRWIAIKGNFVTVFGSFFKDVPTPNQITFLADSTLLVISNTDFKKLLPIFPDLQMIVIKMLTEELLKYQNLTDLLITTKGEERYRKFQAMYPELVQEVAQKHIARILGMNPRHLSRIRSKLATERK